MLRNYYILLLEDKKNLFNLYRHNIYFFKIKYLKNKVLLYVDESNYLKLLKYFNIYNISLYKVGGINKYKSLLRKHFIFIISCLISIFVIILLSNIIFEVNIVTDNNELKKLIKRELDEYEISKYHFIKNYNEKEKIKKIILEECKDKIEWLEIDRVGTKYYIYVLSRKHNNLNNNEKYQNVVAKKNAIITEIKSSKGEIIRKVNDYVNKGDIIISGKIIKNEEVKNIVKAEGQIYGETWYNVKVELPYTYNEKRYTGNVYNTITLSIFDKRFSLFKKDRYKEKEYVDDTILYNPLLPISLNKTRVIEINNSINFYTYDTALEKGMNIAREKLENSLNNDAKILSQKKLKLYEENNIIIIEIFFKVYEDITDYEDILEEGV